MGARPPPSGRHLEISDSFPPHLWAEDWLSESGQKCLDGEELIDHTWTGSLFCSRSRASLAFARKLMTREASCTFQTGCPSPGGRRGVAKRGLQGGLPERPLKGLGGICGSHMKTEQVSGYRAQGSDKGEELPDLLVGGRVGRLPCLH